jgi:hypothetical protein
MLGDSNAALLHVVAADTGVRVRSDDVHVVGDSDTAIRAHDDAHKAVTDGDASAAKTGDMHAGCPAFDGTALSVRRMQVICLFLVELIREYAVTDPRRCTESLSKRLFECALKAFACGGDAEGISLAALKVSFLGTLRAVFMHMAASVGVVDTGIALLDIAVRPSTSQKVGQLCVCVCVCACACMFVCIRR